MKTPSLSIVATGTALALTALIGFSLSDSAAAGDGSLADSPSPFAGDPHLDLFAQDKFPSAFECAACHQKIFDEWRSSAHAYAAISPMFHKFEQALNNLAQGTVNTFCVRCHIPVGTALGEERHIPLWERAPVSTEGITCVTCHRVNEYYGRVNGERRIVEGSIFAPVYGTVGADLDPIIDTPEYGVTTDASETSKLPIHRAAIQSDNLGKSDFCASCHQVAVHPGIKLEVVYEQYRDSPAFREGISCQDCHMAKIPGDPTSGFATAPRAVIANVDEIKEGSKHTDHSFIGPGYSTAHPGIFPHNAKNNPKSRSAIPLADWMTFDWEQDWGKKEFESKIASKGEGASFPAEWSDAGRRKMAREVVDENLRELAARKVRRQAIMEKGSHVDGPFFDTTPRIGQSFAFHYEVSNPNKGHNLPSGSLGAQPELWLNVALIDPDGQNIWESGYVDRYGDMCDVHARGVREGEIAFDDQLFNLQSKFLTTNVKGTDREMYLPVNLDVDQIPFIRPGATPNTVMNHPPFVRMEQRSIPPLGSKKASYEVPAEKLRKPGTYKLAVRLRSRAEPIYFMDFVGATPEMVRRMNERMIDIHPYTVEFEVR